MAQASNAEAMRATNMSQVMGAMVPSTVEFIVSILT